MSLLVRFGALVLMMMVPVVLRQPLVVPVQAFAVTGPYWQSEEHGSPCGKNSVSYPQGMLTCMIGVVTTSALNTHSGWKATNSNAVSGGR